MNKTQIRNFAKENWLKKIDIYWKRGDYTINLFFWEKARTVYTKKTDSERDMKEKIYNAILSLNR